MAEPTRGPWTQDQYGHVWGGDGDRLLVSGISMPMGNHPQAAEAEANARLLLAGRAFLSACTHERDTVSRLDWLSALLGDLSAGNYAAQSEDPEAAATALREAEALLADLREAVKAAQGGEGSNG